jgi:large subunit ribosomal protein L21
MLPGGGPAGILGAEPRAVFDPEGASVYAVIRAGGKQFKVAKGDVIEIDRVSSDGTLEFVPLLVVDDKGKARSGRSELARARVTAKVIGEAKGPKVDIFKYRSKTRYRRSAGHRQKYTSVQVEDIKLTAGGSKKASATAEKTGRAGKTKAQKDKKDEKAQKDKKE